MESNTELQDARLIEMWGELHRNTTNGDPFKPNAYRLAFVDPEFLQRRETRGIRFQLELLKPDLNLIEQGIESTVVVYGSARTLAPDKAAEKLESARASGDAQRIALAERDVRNSHDYEQARRFARHVAEYSLNKPPAERLTICTGGGPGIMEAANRGAHDVGAPNIGLNITLPHEQSCNPYITPSLAFKFHYFALRKMHFMMRAKALVVFPGGFGTFDELFEVLTLVQTHKTKPVPIVLFGSSFWKRALHLEVLVEQGTLSAEDLELFHVTDDPREAWEIIRTFYQI
ncbi:MAG: TIGR00730 family Rossman fold protein [Comamonas sp.]|nr:TIGR00730 family Rossman fold protein [Comamonas sp.]